MKIPIISSMLFSLLFTHHSVFEGTQWKYSYIAILCYPCYRILYLIYRQSGSRLEEVDQQLSIKICFFASASAGLVSTSKVTVLKNLYNLYIHVIRPQRRRNNKVFLPPQKSNFALLLALLKNDLNKRGFILKVFGSGVS